MLFKPKHHFIQQTTFCFLATLNSNRGDPMGHGYAAVMAVTLTGISGCSLSSGCLAYGAFVAAVVAVVLLLA